MSQNLTFQVAKSQSQKGTLETFNRQTLVWQHTYLHINISLRQKIQIRKKYSFSKVFTGTNYTAIWYLFFLLVSSDQDSSCSYRLTNHKVSHARRSNCLKFTIYILHNKIILNNITLFWPWTPWTLSDVLIAVYDNNNSFILKFTCHSDAVNLDLQILGEKSFSTKKLNFSTQSNNVLPRC